MQEKEWPSRRGFYPPDLMLFDVYRIYSSDCWGRLWDSGYVAILACHMSTKGWHPSIYNILQRPCHPKKSQEEMFLIVAIIRWSRGTTVIWPTRFHVYVGFILTIQTSCRSYVWLYETPLPTKDHNNCPSTVIGSVVLVIAMTRPTATP